VYVDRHTLSVGALRAMFPLPPESRFIDHPRVDDRGE
jgi:hypothetical protein